MTPAEAWRWEYLWQHGEEPDLGPTADYDYALAEQLGVQPSRQPDGFYHWPDKGPNGEWLKREDHPTRWMEDYEGILGQPAPEALPRGGRMALEALKQGPGPAGPEMRAVEPTAGEELMGILAPRFKSVSDFATGMARQEGGLGDPLGAVINAPYQVANWFTENAGKALQEGSEGLPLTDPEGTFQADSPLRFLNRRINERGAGVLDAAGLLAPVAGRVGSAAAKTIKAIPSIAMDAYGPQRAASWMFLTKEAKKADMLQYGRAEALEQAGLEPEEIWKRTGWFRAPWDRQWRFEIDDSKARQSMANTGRPTTLGKYWKHPELYENHPELADIPVWRGTAHEGSGAYVVDPMLGDRLQVGRVGNPQVTGHETAHAVQRQSGTAFGGDASTLWEKPELEGALIAESTRVLDEAIGKLRASGNLHVFTEAGPQRQQEIAEEIKRIAANNVYLRLGGEAEARLTAERLGMSAAARAQRFPLKHMEEMLAREKTPGGIDSLIPRFIDRPTAPTQPVLKWNANGRFPINESDWQRQHRLMGGYDEIVEIDPAKALADWEARNKDPLAWNPGRTERLRGLLDQGTAIDDYPKVSMDDFRGFDVGDGRHRISLAADRGDTIQVATRPEYAPGLRSRYGVESAQSIGDGLLGRHVELIDQPGGVLGKTSLEKPQDYPLAKMQRWPELSDMGDLGVATSVRPDKYTGLSPEGVKFIKQFEGPDFRNKTAVHYNNKTGLSLDFSTSCTKRHGGGCNAGACAYCYVEHERTFKEKMGITGAKAKKLVENDYEGELMRMPAEVVTNLNRDGGMRMFSFGDFRPGIDDANVERVLEDARKRGLYIKAITKEPELIAKFGDHPNFRANLSIDYLPRNASNSWTVEDAIAAKGGRENIKLRGVALNMQEAERMAKDKRIDVITLYHGPTGDRAFNMIKEQNPQLVQRFGSEEALRAETARWENMAPRNNNVKEFMERNKGRVCCQGGKCSTDPNTKCGFASKAIGALLPGVFVEEWFDEGVPEDF